MGGRPAHLRFRGYLPVAESRLVPAGPGVTMERVQLWIAQGFWVGRIPVAPGTFGSVLGVFWVAALVSSRSLWCYTLGTMLGLACSIWLCGRAEQILSRTDPSSVVLDEIAAMPLCFAGWLV